MGQLSFRFLRGSSSNGLKQDERARLWVRVKVRAQNNLSPLASVVADKPLFPEALANTRKKKGMKRAGVRRLGHNLFCGGLKCPKMWHRYLEG